MQLPTPDADKSTWRRWASDSRMGLELAEISAAVVRGLLEWPILAASRRVLVFLPAADEVDLRALLDAGLDCAFAATHTPDRGGALTVHELGGPLEVHGLGFLQPHAGAPRMDPAELDLLLLPGLAFDLWGTRLGRGAGYFDRLLMQVPVTVPLVGVAPAVLVVDRLPREPHDVPVGYLATEGGVIAVAASR